LSHGSIALIDDNVNQELAGAPWTMKGSSDRRGDPIEEGCKHFLSNPFNIGGPEEVLGTVIRPFYVTKDKT
jgi:hypothetical protein